MTRDAAGWSMAVDKRGAVVLSDTDGGQDTFVIKRFKVSRADLDVLGHDAAFDRARDRALDYIEAAIDREERRPVTVICQGVDVGCGWSGRRNGGPIIAAYEPCPRCGSSVSVNKANS